MSEPIIKIEGVSYRYPRTKKWVLKDINLEIGKGEFVAVLGENGAGKTTFCQLFNGVIPHSQSGTLRGNITVSGLNTQEYPTGKLAQKVGIVLEDPETQIFTTKVVNEVAFGLENINTPIDEIIENVNWALSVVRLSSYAQVHPTALSGGQKQRLAVAAAIAMKPDILVLDEPTSQLDPIGTTEVFDVLEELKNKYGITIVIATHKGEEVARVADKAIVIKDGKIIEHGTPHKIFKNTPLLKDNWIRPPQVSEMANRLMEKGIPLNNYPTIKEEAIAALNDWIGGVQSE